MLVYVEQLLTELLVKSQTIPLVVVKQEGIVALLLWQKLDSPLYVNPGGIIMTSSEQPGISMQINIQVIQLNIIWL
jgi:hypothetical protein